MTLQNELAATMTAWRQSRYGGTEAVTQARIDVPTPGKDEVLLRVRATALNSGDVHLMRGEPGVLRLGFGLRGPRVPVRGMDVAGTVVAVGPGACGFAVGDEVVGELPGGGLAEFVVAPVKRLVPRPGALAPVIAATLPIAGGTAWQALALGGVMSGSRVLVVGAGGGVGTFTVALAALRGADVTALCGARAVDVVTSLGAAHVFDYREVQPGSPTLGGAFDAVIDIAGTAPLSVLRGAVREGGVVVSVGGGVDGWFDPLPRIVAGSVSFLGSKRRFRPLVAMTKPEELAQLVALAETGDLVPAIERTWPLAEAGAALAHIDAGHTVGKIVVTVA